MSKRSVSNWDDLIETAAGKTQNVTPGDCEASRWASASALSSVGCLTVGGVWGLSFHTSQKGAGFMISNPSELRELQHPFLAQPPQAEPRGAGQTHCPRP